jgi:hypothetical protein
MDARLLVWTVTTCTARRDILHHTTPKLEEAAVGGLARGIIMGGNHSSSEVKTQFVNHTGTRTYES